MSDVLQELQRLKAELDEEKAARAEAVEAARLEGREAAEAMGASTWEEVMQPADEHTSFTRSLTLPNPCVPSPPPPQPETQLPAVAL